MSEITLPPRTPLREQLVQQMGEALLQEVMLTPKPGLVDKRNNGAHRDMNLGLFVRSIEALLSQMPRFYDLGFSTAALAPVQVLPMLRPLGLAGEAQMLRTTGGVNTHKGAIFAFGLLLAAAGRLTALQRPLAQQPLCETVSHFCRGLVQRELGGITAPRTAGERLYQQHGLTGARGEAESGFHTVRSVALPTWRRMMAKTGQKEQAQLQVLLHLMAWNADTNLAARGGMAGLHYVQQQAQGLLWQGGVQAPDGAARLYALDDALIARHLSPGGSADLLAVTLFLAAFPAGEAEWAAW
ncbi:triphosphoribosyl-dephospho-CoA synthase CitG [Chimaeribacter arupi]|uniref:triphosphoribosyl-dephospho-CoA synthase CitG n=1 Tax=Chimaeribacter arupi TaxID=2060066 RepID=UPI002944F86C|nr:triphosphoribosyl-dephospho-CoA synthase CitG [Chimaeribacter arupi]MDV5138761.1 triphosphoribosyl-dephospho-CoA synthase CitG [Chimaeribacter arupi]